MAGGNYSRQENSVFFSKIAFEFAGLFLVAIGTPVKVCEVCPCRQNFLGMALPSLHLQVKIKYFHIVHHLYSLLCKPFACRVLPWVLVV